MAAHSACRHQLLCERVPASRTDIVFLALDLLLQTILWFAGKIANHHGFPPETRCDGSLFFPVSNATADSHGHSRKFRPSRPSGVTLRAEAGQRLGFLVKGGDKV